MTMIDRFLNGELKENTQKKMSAREFLNGSSNGGLRPRI